MKKIFIICFNMISLSSEKISKAILIPKIKLELFIAESLPISLFLKLIPNILKNHFHVKQNNLVIYSFFYKITINAKMYICKSC